MAKKEFTYRGVKTEQLQQMSIEEFARLLPSRERRSLTRGLTEVEKNLMAKLSKRDKIKTHAREMVIVPQMIGKTIQVHNGKQYTAILITEEMIGHRLGQFVLTRKIGRHASPGVTGRKGVSVK